MWTLCLFALSQDVAMASAYFLDYSVSAAFGGVAHSLFNQSRLSQKSSSETFKMFRVGIVSNRLSGVLGPPWQFRRSHTASFEELSLATSTPLQ